MDKNEPKWTEVESALTKNRSEWIYEITGIGQNRPNLTMIEPEWTKNRTGKGQNRPELNDSITGNCRNGQNIFGIDRK